MKSRGTYVALGLVNEGSTDVVLPFLISIIAPMSNRLATPMFKVGEKKAEKNLFFYNMMMRFLNNVLPSINISINFIVFYLLY